MKNILRNISIVLSMIFATILTVFLIEQYCQAFNQFGLFAKDRLLNQPILVLIITPAFFWMSAYLCRKFAVNASGNSVEHFRESLIEAEKTPYHFGKLSDLLGVKVIIIKTVSSLLCVFGGGALGREGPAVHMSAGIFAIIANKLKSFLPNIKVETWVLAGGATGLTVAFHAPIAGFVFAVEKLIKSKPKNLISDAIWVLAVILIVIGALYYHHTAAFDANANFQFSSQIILLIFTAIICGLVAFFFKKINKYFYSKLASIKSNWWHLIPIMAGLAVAVISLYCGVYSFSGGVYTVDAALLSPDTLLSYKEVGGRIINTIISFISGCAGGLVAPAIAIGAGIGSIASSFMPSANVDVFLLIGMAAFLGAVLGEPIAAAIIIFEITGQSVSNIAFLLLSSVASFAVLKMVEKYYPKKI